MQRTTRWATHKHARGRGVEQNTVYKLGESVVKGGVRLDRSTRNKIVVRRVLIPPIKILTHGKKGRPSNNITKKVVALSPSCWAHIPDLVFL